MYALYGQKFSHSEVAKSVENLLLQFSKTEKFRVVSSRAEKFYIKSKYRGQYILVYAGNKEQDRFSNIFNPEYFFRGNLDINIKEQDKQTETGITSHEGIVAAFYSTIILSC